MSDSTRVRRYGHDQMTLREYAAQAAVKAGALLERASGGVQANSTEAEDLQEVLVAADRRGLGYEVGDEYPSGDEIPTLNCNAGAGVHLLLAGGANLATAANANITEGDQLVSNGDGTVRKLDTSKTGETDDAVVAVADEDLDNSGASSEAALATEVTR